MFKLFKPVLANGDIAGMLFSSGKNWQEQRRFSLHVLKDLGLGKEISEKLIAEEAKELCDELEAHTGEALNMVDYLWVSVFNVLWRIVSSEKLGRDDERVKSLMSIFAPKNDSGDTVLKNLLTSIGLPAMYFLSRFFNVDSFMKTIQKGDITGYILSVMEHHEKTFQDDSKRDFVDFFIEEAQKGGKESFRGLEGRKNLRGLIGDFFAAGGGTTATGLLFTIMYLIKYPEVQDKVVKEINGITGRSRQLGTSDMARTPYTNAVILEVIRMRDRDALIIPHHASASGWVGKYFIPKDTIIQMSKGAVLHNAEHFDEPGKFNPERFLDGDGKFINDPKVGIAFGMGKRRCPGETMARMELYIFITHLLDRFILKAHGDPKDLSLEPLHSMINFNKPFKMTLEARA